MGREGVGGRFPRRTDFAPKAVKKPQVVEDPATSFRTDERSNTLGSLSRFMPGIAPHQVIKNGKEVVRADRVNHVNGTRVTPIFERKKGKGKK